MERFGLTLPLRNQYFVFRVGQNFSEKGGKTVTNPEACLLDWPITELGKEQVLRGSQVFLDTRGLVWPAWKRLNNLAILSSNQGGKEAARKLRKTAFFTWAKAAAESRPSDSRGGSAGGAREQLQQDGRTPRELEVYSSDFKAAKQTAEAAAEFWAQDAGVAAVNLRYTELLRERSLGASVEHAGFDGCNREELAQLWALDNLDGAHRLGGIESCEQALSRCMRLIREIESSTSSKQVVLISHCDLVHIFQTIFCSVKPGAHRLLPLIDPGEVKELKFQTVQGAADDDMGEQELEDEGSRHFNVFFCSSQGLDRHRDVVIEQAFSVIADACSRKCVAFSYTDLRLPVDDPHGLGIETVANRLATVEESNALVCLIDPHKEAYLGVDESSLAGMTREDLCRLFVDELDESYRGAVTSFLELHAQLKGQVDDLAQREGDKERVRLKQDRPDLIRKEVERMSNEAGAAAAKLLCDSMPGLGEILDVYEHMKDFLAEQGQTAATRKEQEVQMQEMTKHVVEYAKDFEDLKLKSMIRGVLQVVMKKNRRPDMQEFRSYMEAQEEKYHAVRRANEKYPWVGRWAESSLLEMEVRYATLSSVPAIAREHSFFYVSKADKRKKRNSLITTDELQRMQRSKSAESTSEGETRVTSSKHEIPPKGVIKGIDTVMDLVEALKLNQIEPPVYTSPKQVADMIIRDFLQLLDETYPTDTVPISLADERSFHDGIARDRGDLYVPEPRLSKVLSAHAQGDARLLSDLGVYMSSSNIFQALIVVGEPGSGKSAIMAHTGLSHRRTSPDDIVIMHFSQGCFDTRDPIRMMQRFVLEMLGKDAPSRLGVNSRDPDHTALVFIRAMEQMHFRFQGKKNVVVLIDSIDQLSEADTNIDLWLPYIFPTTIRVIVSCRDGPCFDKMKGRQSPSVRIPTLRPEARSAICAAYLARIGRVFSREQMSAVVGAPFSCNPLFLCALAQQCRLCYSRLLDEDPSPAPVSRELDRSRDIKELYGNMLAALDDQYGGSHELGYENLVQYTLTYLWASRKGLLQFELYEALKHVCNVSFERLQKLLAELKQRVIHTQGRLRLFHQEFNHAVERRYLGKYFDTDTTDLMINGHKLLADFFQTRPHAAIRKVEEYPYQLCYCIAAYPEDAQQLEEYLLTTVVFREMATVRFHSDLCGYWRVLCQEPGSMAEIAGKYMGSFQEYVYDTGDKGSFPEMCFSVGFLLEDLGQYRNAKRVYTEALRAIENLELMHPVILSSLRPNLAAQLFELRPKVLLHLGTSLRKAGFYGQADNVLQSCSDLVESTSFYSWARADAQIQLGMLAVERGHHAAAEKAFKRALSHAESHDITLQDNVMEKLMDLYRSNTVKLLQQGIHRKALRFIDKEQKVVNSARSLWTKYTYLDPATSRPPSAIVKLIETSKRPLSATYASFRTNLEYEPTTPNQPTNLTVKFQWNRMIEEGDEFTLQLKHIRAGGDRESLEAEGPSGNFFSFSWVELTRTLHFSAKTFVSPSDSVFFTIPHSQRLRLPVRQAGDHAVLPVEAKVDVIKNRIRAEKIHAENSSRPGTGQSSATGSRPASRAGGRPSSLDEEEDDDGARGSPDIARLKSRAGELFSLKTLVLAVKHAEMLGYKDEWLRSRHERQLQDIVWHMRYSYDDKTTQELLDLMRKKQTNELDGAHIIYEKALLVEKEVLMIKAEKVIQDALNMQEYVFGGSHPLVTDTMMISARMYVSREELWPAMALLQKVWKARTGKFTPEHLPLGHEREMECSLYHVAIRQWLAGSYKNACIVFEHLRKSDERHPRNMDSVWSMLCLCHLHGATLEEKVALAGESLPGVSIVRPLYLNGVKLHVTDVLGRETALTPPTTMPAWAAIGQCLKTNHLLKVRDMYIACNEESQWDPVRPPWFNFLVFQVLDLSDSSLGPDGAEMLHQGIKNNKSLNSLNLARNGLTAKGAEFVGEMIKGNLSITELDLSCNELEDHGIRHIAAGIAEGTQLFNTSLRRLCLADNNLTHHGALTLSLAMKVVGVGIINLDISLNKLYDKGITHICDALYMGVPLVTLNIGDNMFGMEGILKVAEAVECSESLAVLDVANRYRNEVGKHSRGNTIDGLGAKILANAIAESIAMTSLDISGNVIGADGGKALFEILKPPNIFVDVPVAERDFLGVVEQWNARNLDKQRGSKGGLRSLKMRGCGVGSSGAQSIAKELCRNPALIGLDLMNSGIGGTGVASIAVALGSNKAYNASPNTTLTYLNLQNCDAFKAGATHISSMLKHNYFLRKLVLADNDIGPEGAAAMAEALAENKSLSELSIAKNNLGDRGAAVLGRSLHKCVRLSYLDVGLNGIGDAGMTDIAKGLAHNATIKTLDVSRNRFSSVGSYYLNIAAKTRPVHNVTRGGGALRMIGVHAEDFIREDLPKIVTEHERERLLTIRRLSLDS